MELKAKDMTLSDAEAYMTLSVKHECRRVGGELRSLTAWKKIPYEIVWREGEGFYFYSPIAQVYAPFEYDAYNDDDADALIVLGISTGGTPVEKVQFDDARRHFKIPLRLRAKAA